ncbi:MAG: hypothetical protein HLUCCA04_13365 [Oceanicaulis sp. HLUCCA04]|nr:MAG: hypothetical protein HLUCCA04_13365 [Oceanicaulis sp. HLUCCA04]
MIKRFGAKLLTHPCGLGQVADRPDKPGKPAARTGANPGAGNFNHAAAAAPLLASLTSIFTPGPMVELIEILRIY